MKRGATPLLLIVVGTIALAGLGLGVAFGLDAAARANTGLSFRDSDMLYALAAIGPFTGLVILAWYLRQRATARFGDHATARSLIVGRSGVFRAVRGVLVVLGTTLVILTLAGPQYGSRTRVLRKQGVDVVIALDFSKSMLARDVRPDRISRAKAELLRFVEELDGDRVGIVAFAGETMEFPMTVDYAAIGLFLRDLGPYDMPVGGTAIGRALVSAKRLLERGNTRSNADEADGADRSDEVRSPSRVVILFTDGEDHEGDPVEAAHELADAGIRVYVVGIGSRTGEPVPTYGPDGTWTGYMRDDQGNLVTSALTAESEGVLREIAEATGGKYFRARQGGVGVDQIRREMRRMKQEERESRRVVVNEDRYGPILLAAFLLLVAEGLLPDAWIGRRKRRTMKVSARTGRGRTTPKESV